MARVTRKNPTITSVDVDAPRVRSSSFVKARLAQTVMDTPPTLSASASATITSVSTAVNVIESDPRIRTSGARSMTKSGAIVPAGSTKLDGTVDTFQGSWRHSFDYDGSAFEFRTTPGTDTRLLIWVDDRPHAAAPIQLTSISGTTSGSPTWLKVDFTTRARRRICIELLGTNQVNFNSINRQPNATLMPPIAPSSRLVWVGDSQAYGIGANAASGDPGGLDVRQAYSIWTAYALGIEDVFNSTCQPSAGMVQPIGTTIGNARSRLTSDLLPLAPEILVIQSSVNDGAGWPANQAAIEPTTLDYIRTVQAALPRCRIIVTGPIYAGQATSIHKAIGASAKAAADAAGVPFIDTTTDADPVFTGTGSPGNIVNDGNADFYREYGSVYTHPNRVGHQHLANWMAGKLAAILKLPL